MTKEYFPLFLNLEEKSFQVFGGGLIATRRILTLLAFKAKVYIVSSEISESVEGLIGQNKDTLPGKICDLQLRPYQRGDVREDMDYIVAATDSEKVNEMIYQESRHKEKLINVVSDQSLCDYFFPAIVQKNHLTIGMTTNGWNHHYLKFVAEYLKEHIPSEEEFLQQLERNEKSSKTEAKNDG